MPAAATSTSPPVGSFVWGHHQQFLDDPLGFLVGCARDYGDVVPLRYGPIRFYMVSDPELIGEVLTTKAASFRKDDGLRRARVILGDGLLTSEGEAHERHSRLAQPSFRPKAVEAYAAGMVGATVAAADAWPDGGRIELAVELSRLALTIVAQALFGADVREDAAEVAAAVHEALPLLDDRMNRMMPVPLIVPTPANRRFKKSVAVLDRVVYRMIRERRAAPGREDLLSRLLAAEENGHRLSDQQVRDEIMTLFLAGHETTANAMAFTLWLLAAHPEVEREVRAEVDKVLGGRPAVAADAMRLPRLGEAVHESMRLYPPAWLLGRQTVEPVELGGGRVKLGKRTIVGMSPYVVQRDKRWWADPTAFRPERFGPEAPRPAAYTYFPFGGGKRICIGRSFAMLELSLVLGTLLQKVELRPDTSRPLALAPHITLRPADGMPATVLKRTVPSGPAAAIVGESARVA